MEKKVLMSEITLRLCCFLAALAAAFLVRMDTQRKEIKHTVKKTTYKDLEAFGVFEMVEVIVAGHNLLQLCKCMVCNTRHQGSTKGSVLWFSWACFFIDQEVDGLLWQHGHKIDLPLPLF